MVYIAMMLLIPAIAELNHLGGQSTVIPWPRITCRVFGTPIAIFLALLLSGLPIESSAIVLGLCIAGMALWAVPHWGQMFMSINGGDFRDYNRYRWITAICDYYVGVSPLTRLTSDQCREWGMVFGVVRGAFMYPLFMALAVVLTPWAFLIGLFCLLQGVIYRNSSDVLHAEYTMGSLIGIMMGLIIWLSPISQ